MRCAIFKCVYETLETEKSSASGVSYDWAEFFLSQTLCKFIKMAEGCLLSLLDINYFKAG